MANDEIRLATRQTDDGSLARMCKRSIKSAMLGSVAAILVGGTLLTSTQANEDALLSFDTAAIENWVKNKSKQQASLLDRPDCLNAEAFLSDNLDACLASQAIFFLNEVNKRRFIENQALRRTLEITNRRRNESQAKVERAEIFLQDAKVQIDDLNDQLEAERTHRLKLSQDLDLAYARERETQEEGQERLTGEIRSLKVQLQTAQKEQVELTQALEASLAETETQARRLEGQLKQRNAAKDALSVKLAETERDLAQARLELETARAESQEKSIEQSRALEALKAESQKISRAKADLALAMAKVEQERDLLASDLQQLRQQSTLVKNRLKADHDAALAEVQRVENSLKYFKSEAQGREGDLRAQLEEALRGQRFLASKVDDLEERYAQIQSTQALKSARIGDQQGADEAARVVLKREMSKLDLKNQALEQRLTQAQERIARVSQDRDDSLDAYRFLGEQLALTLERLP